MATAPRATARKAEIIASMERRLNAADDPLHLRCVGGVSQFGEDVGGGRRRYILWATPPFLSTWLLAHGRGLKVEDDGIPF